MSDLPKFELERVFNAPRALVWRTWTEPDLLCRWYGPNVACVIHKLDVTPGGLWLNEMKMANNSFFGRTEYLEVSAPEKLVMVQSVSDAAWNIIANPMMPDWPRKLLTVVTFEDISADTDGQTKMVLTWQPMDASAEEIACFAAAVDGMGKGWGAGMDLLEQILAELQN